MEMARACAWSPNCFIAHAVRFSASVSHCAPHRYADPRAATEPRLDGRNYTAHRRTLDAQQTHEHGAPFLRAVVDGRESAGSIRGPSKLTQRIDNEAHESINTTGGRSFTVGPCLADRADEPQPHVEAHRNAQAEADVRRFRPRVDEIRSGLGLPSRRRRLASLLGRCITRRDAEGERDHDDSSRPARAMPRPHVARSRHSASV